MSRALRRVAGGVAVVAATTAGITQYNRPAQPSHADRATLMHTALETVPSRAHQLRKLRASSAANAAPRAEFDVLVIGGGATGAACALDASLRDLRVALVERDDFASGTSSRSTKLIHGGVRYLEKAFFNLDPAQLNLVFEALRERAVMMHQAPHLAHSFPTLLPCYKTWELPFYWLGLKLYDALSALGHGLLHISKFVPPGEALERFPTLSRSSEGQRLRGGIMYYDGQMDDARFNLGVALTAALYGAAVTNHTEVLSLLREHPPEAEADPGTGGSGRVTGARVRDTLTGEEFDVRAKVVINATGPFTDEVRRMEDGEAEAMIMPSAGVHIALPEFYSADGIGLIVPKTKDGRVVFMLPWLGRTIAGTTDSSTTITPLPRPDAEEVSFILDALADYLHIDVRASDVQSAWSGIRPLAVDAEATALAKAKKAAKKAKAKAKADAKKAKSGDKDADGEKDAKPEGDGKEQDDDDDADTQNVVREHAIRVSDNGLVTIAGGKWTTQRAMGEDAVDAAIKAGGLEAAASRCKTQFVRLIGAHTWDASYFTFLAQRYERGPGQELDVECAKHLSRAYGDLAYKVAELAEGDARGLGRKLVDGYPVLEAEIVYSARHEYCETAIDFLARRCRLLFLDSKATTKALPRVVELMGAELGWDAARRAREMAEARTVIDTFTCGIPES